MAIAPNLSGKTQADFISNEATPGVTFLNQGTGPGLAVDSAVISAASIGTIFGSPALKSGSTTSTVLTVQRTAIGSYSAALGMFSVSGASVPVFEFQANSLVSMVSIVFAASANWGGLMGVRVKYSDGTTYGWIPVLPSASCTAAAI